MLSAVLVQEGKEARVFDMPYLRAKGKTKEALGQQRWACKFCEERMIPKAGAIRQWYFAHHRNASACPVNTEAEPESERHRQLKRAAAEALKRHFGADVASLEYEVRIPEAQRIADALLTLQDGTRVAVEAQLSPLGVEQVQTRTEAYLREDMEVVWVFLEQDQGGLKEGGLWDTCRKWLLGEGHLVLTARATITHHAIPLDGPG